MTARLHAPSEQLRERSGLGLIAQLPEAGDPRLSRHQSIAERLHAVKLALLADPTIADPEVRIWQALGTGASDTSRAMRWQLARVRVPSRARTINAIELALDPHRDAHAPGCRPDVGDEDGPRVCCDVPYLTGPTWDRPNAEPAEAIVRQRERARIAAIERTLRGAP